MLKPTFFSHLCLITAAFALAGCGDSTPPKNQAPEHIQYSGLNSGLNKDSSKLSLQPPEPADSVPKPRQLPPDIFASDIESANLSEDAFTKDYAAAVEKATAIASVKIEAPLIVWVKVHPGDSNGSKIDLHKVWLKCKDKPGERVNTIQPGVRALFDMVNFVNKPLEGEEQSDKFVPLVRNRQFLENLFVQHGGKKTVSEPLSRE